MTPAQRQRYQQEHEQQQQHTHTQPRTSQSYPSIFTPLEASYEWVERVEAARVQEQKEGIAHPHVQDEKNQQDVEEQPQIRIIEPDRESEQANAMETQRETHQGHQEVSTSTTPSSTVETSLTPSFPNDGDHSPISPVSPLLPMGGFSSISDLVSVGSPFTIEDREIDNDTVMHDIQHSHYTTATSLTFVTESNLSNSNTSSDSDSGRDESAITTPPSPSSPPPIPSRAANLISTLRAMFKLPSSVPVGRMLDILLWFALGAIAGAVGARSYLQKQALSAPTPAPLSLSIPPHSPWLHDILKEVGSCSTLKHAWIDLLGNLPFQLSFLNSSLFSTFNDNYCFFF